MHEMQKLDDGIVQLGFADPPFNIGFDYNGEYQDKKTYEEYRDWSAEWMGQMHRVLDPYGSFWLHIGDGWVAELKIMAQAGGFRLRSWIIWYYTFGVNSPAKFTRSHTHLLYFTKHPTNFVFHANEVRVPSAREVVYNDKRANPDGRLPDDTWILRPQVLEMPPDHDTWYFPRVAGTFHRRVPGAPNQMPEQLLGRIIRICSGPDQLVLDPFVGTGTTLAVAKKLGRRYLGFDISKTAVACARRRVKRARLGEPLDR
jgi:site-specific DNA-methyltransferase (adenine-specific)